MTDKLIEMAKEVGTTEYYCAYAKEEHCPCEDKGEIKCESTELYRAIFTKDQLKAFANLIRADEQSKLGEPVAWMWDNDGVIEYSIDIYAKEYYEKHYGVVMTPLYILKDK